MPCRAISIIPELAEAPTKIPIAATISTTLNLAALAPTAGLIKLTASFATPTDKSQIASMNKNNKMPKYSRLIDDSFA